MELLLPDPGLIVWQLVGFLILVFILGKFAWKPILNGLKTREASIEEALSSADKAREELSKLQADNEKLLQEARAEADQIRKDAAATGEKIKAQIEEDARSNADRMIKDAQAESATMKQAAMADVKNQVAALSLNIAEKVLRKELDNQGEQKALVDEYLKELNVN